MIATIIAVLIGLLCFIGFVVQLEDTPQNAVMCLVVSFLFFSMGGVILHKEGYKSGQIDAINNNIKYELVEQPNGESVWKQIEN
ncbi:MAG TPA: hypothetical protein VLA13_03910, partial [Massilibacterium sp.]|nr:hypothetical protein [Massilibacterium sp.]